MILQYRVQIELSGAEAAAEVRPIIDQLYSIYSANLTSLDLVLPFSTSFRDSNATHLVSIEVQLEGDARGPHWIAGYIEADVEGGRVTVTTRISDTTELDWD